jgi:hypothetical protein
MISEIARHNQKKLNNIQEIVKKVNHDKALGTGRETGGSSGGSEAPQKKSLCRQNCCQNGE